MMSVESFTKLLQLSISPLALISGAALLLLSITNRLGRSIDRARSLIPESEKGAVPLDARTKEQLRVLLRRSEFLRNSVLCIVFSIFLSTLMVLGLFLRLFWEIPMEGPILFFFFLSVISLCAGLIFFQLDVSLALKALKVEAEQI